MRWSQVCLEAIGYSLPEERVSSAELEERLTPLYEKFNLGLGQLVSMTGIQERRFWPPAPSMADGAAQAGRDALEQAGVSPEDVGALIYGGVCRDDLEPATACRVADQLGIRGRAVVLDHANACLGVLNGMVTVANMIELGQIKAGLVVSCESAREIVETNLQRMLDAGDVETWKYCMPTLTGGSGAIGVVLTHRDFSYTGRRVLGAVARAAPEHHRIARWGSAQGYLGQSAWVMETDAPSVLTHGVELGMRTWEDFLREMEWQREDVERVVCHQVGSGHQRAILTGLGLEPALEYSTYETLGNIGTVSLPITAARAAEAGFLSEGDRLGLLGIGTGLNCLMMGVQW
ncbi:MAG: 3-oxoacyl-ACP synthase III [Myxococcota bacterium]|nr:3-oxoacyl-ACP synthase III [Myxococcota bacterium]